MPPICFPSTETVNCALPFHASSDTCSANVFGPLPTAMALLEVRNVKLSRTLTKLGQRCSRNRISVARRTCYVKISIGGVGTAVCIVEKVHCCGMAANSECAQDIKGLSLTRRMGRSGGLDTTDLLPIDRDSELRVARRKRLQKQTAPVFEGRCR